VRILDDRYRLFGIINPVDLIAVLIVVAGVFVAANMLFGDSTPTAVTAETVPVTFSVLYPDVPLNVFESADFTEGDVVNKVGGKPLGKLVSWESTPSVQDVEIDGKLVPVVSPSKVDVVLKVEGEAESTKKGLLVGDVLIKNNLSVQVETPDFQGKSRIIRVEAGK